MPVKNHQKSTCVCGCVYPHIYGLKFDCMAVNVSIATGFIALPIYTHICICLLGDRVGFLERILVCYQ